MPLVTQRPDIRTQPIQIINKRDGFAQGLGPYREQDMVLALPPLLRSLILQEKENVEAVGVEPGAQGNDGTKQDKKSQI